MRDTYTYMTIKTAAHMLEVSPATVRRLIERGHLAGFKKSPGRNSPYVVARASVTAYIKAYRPTNSNGNDATD